jgi:hypothetical protein
MNFLENLPGGRAGEANRSDPQSGVSRLIPVNVPVPLPAPEIPALPRFTNARLIDLTVGLGLLRLSIALRDP